MRTENGRLGNKGNWILRHRVIDFQPKFLETVPAEAQPVCARWRAEMGAIRERFRSKNWRYCKEIHPSETPGRDVTACVCRLTCAVRRVRRLVPYFAGRAVADGIGVWFSWLIAHYRTKGWTKRWWSRRSKEESLSCFRKSWSRFCLQSCDLCMTVVFRLVRKLFI